MRPLIVALLALTLVASLSAQSKSYEAGLLRDHSTVEQTGWHDGVTCFDLHLAGFDCSGDFSPIYSTHKLIVLVTADGVEHRLSDRTKFWGENFTPAQLLDLSKEGVAIKYRLKGKDAFILDPAGRELHFVVTGEVKR